jgi:hypothetical protein
LRESAVVQDSAAWLLATKTGLTVAEAKSRLDLQDRLMTVVGEVRAGIGDAADGGPWFDNEDGGRMKVGVVTSARTPNGPNVDRAKQILAAAGLRGSVDFVSVDYSYSQLLAAH